MHTNRLSQVCPTSLPNMPEHELQQKKRPGFRLKSLLQEEACYWKLFPNLVYTTKTFMVCVLDTCHTPLHILSAPSPTTAHRCSIEFHGVFVQLPMGVNLIVSHVCLHHTPLASHPRASLMPGAIHQGEYWHYHTATQK